jgi:hypothetical protein
MCLRCADPLSEGFALQVDNDCKQSPALDQDSGLIGTEG